MRVPISSADLRVKYGFNRLAKKLQRNWPSDVSLSLTYSQEILSRGLGYQDFHDLQCSADKSLQTGIQPSQNEVRARISTSIVAFCQSKKVITISDRDVARLVCSTHGKATVARRTPAGRRNPSPTLAHRSRSLAGHRRHPKTSSAPPEHR